jgi:hypothetical protein
MRSIALLLPVQGFLRWTTTVVAGGVVGLGAYLALCALLRVGELQVMLALARKLVARKDQA